MKNAAVKIDKKETANLILEAAVNRFSVYGYNKTTMAEIAEDADMSAANIYRFYKNKEEIAAACASNKMAEKTAALKQIVRDSSLSATEKLEQYAHTLLKLTQAEARENRKIDEMCTEITNSRPDIIHQQIKNECALLMEILSFGNQTGEFLVDDVMKTAGAINASLVVFDVPKFMHLFDEIEFREKLQDVVNLLLIGLKTR
ncbi:MAG: TetR/AcrR family transcriptional regulator [Pseudomonadota bacterium]